MDESELSKTLRFINPSYNELHLSLMAFTFFILVGLNWSELYPGTITKFFIYFAVMFIGSIISIYHLFIIRNKKDIEKNFMLFFALIMCIISGIFGGIYAIEHNPISIFTLFPLMNVIQAIIIIMFIYMDKDTPDKQDKIFSSENISDRDYSPKNLIIGLPAIILIIFLGQYVFRLHPILIFSFSLTYTTIISNALIKLNLFKPKRRKVYY